MPTGGCEARKEATLHIRIGKVASFAIMAGVEITSYTLSPICPLGDGMGRRRNLVCYTNIIVRFDNFVNSEFSGGYPETLNSQFDSAYRFGYHILNS